MSTYRLSRQDAPQSEIEIRSLDTHQPIEWLRDGWSDFKAAPVPSLLYGLGVAAFGLLLAYLSTGANRFYLVPFLFSGFLIITPMLSIGLMAMAGQHQRGQSANVRSAWHVISARQSSLAMMGLFLLLVFINWIMLSNLMFGGVFHEVLPTYGEVRPLPVMFLESLPFLSVYGGLAIILAAVVFRITALSIPMMLDRDVDAFNATFASWRAVGENWRPMSIWAVIIAALCTLGFITYFVGLVVIIPWLGYASWHAYRDSLAPMD